MSRSDGIGMLMVLAAAYYTTQAEQEWHFDVRYAIWR
jgi:hypothetical protein